MSSVGMLQKLPGWTSSSERKKHTNSIPWGVRKPTLAILMTMLNMLISIPRAVSLKNEIKQEISW